MKDFEALVKVYSIASRANDLGGQSWTDEEKEALGAVRRYIEANRDNADMIDQQHDDAELGRRFREFNERT